MISDLPVPRPRIRVRRNVRWLAAGVLAVALGGLVTGFLFLSVADTQLVLKLTRTVHRGEALAPSDLVAVPVGRLSEVEVVPAERLEMIVGQHARSDLVAGTLLVESGIGAVELPPGLARVGLKVEAGRIPSTALHPGMPVRVVAVPASTEAGQPPASVDAVISSAPVGAADGSLVLDVNVPAAEAEQVARLGALKQVAIIRVGEG